MTSKRDLPTLDLTKGINVKVNPRALTNKCLVIDIDETVLYTCSEDEARQFLALNLPNDPNCLDIRGRIYYRSIEGLGERRGDGSVTEICGIVRPGFNEFMNFALGNPARGIPGYFQVVAFWTAGLDRYGIEMVDWLCRWIADPHIIYTRGKCEKRDGNNTKPLNKMFEAELPSVMTFNNTFILDDNTYSFDYDNPKNGIHIPHYRPRITCAGLHKDDPSLRELMVWLMRPEVMQSPDVQLLDKSKIFSLPVGDVDDDDDDDQ